MRKDKLEKEKNPDYPLSVKDWIGERGRALNKESLHLFDFCYKQLSQESDRLLEVHKTAQHQNINETLHGMMNLTHTHDELGKQNIIIKWVHIPIYPEQNRLRFHTIFFVNMEHWNIQDIKGLQNLCINQINHRYLDTPTKYKKLPITVFIAGKQRGAFQYKLLKKHLIKYNIVLFNTNINKAHQIRYNIYRQLYKFFGTRTYNMLESMQDKPKVQCVDGKYRRPHLYGTLKQVHEGLVEFCYILKRGASSYYKIWKEYKKTELIRKRKILLEISNRIYTLSESDKKSILGKEFYNHFRKSMYLHNESGNNHRLKSQMEAYLLKLSKAKVVKPH